MSEPLITEAVIDDWKLTGQIMADDVYGEFLFNFFGERGVPGAPIDMNQPPPADLMQQMMGSQPPQAGVNG